MPQPAAVFAKRTGGPAPAGRADVPTRAKQTTEEEARAVSLDVAPLIAPYRKQGRLTLRVERMAVKSRLSAGRNNGDGSWSLASDELEDLTYLLPDSATEAHTLAIRIVSLSGGSATTLAVVDIPVSAAGAPAPVRTSMSAKSTSRADEARLNLLRQELARVQTQLDARDAELSQLRQSAGGTPTDSRGAHEAQALRQDLAGLQAQLAARDAEIATLREAAAKPSLASAPAIDVDAAIKAARAVWQHDAAERQAASEKQSSEERRRLAGEAAEALAAAERTWKAQKDADLAAATAEWQERTQRAVDEARARERALREGGEAAEITSLRQQLAVLETQLAARDAALAKAQARYERENEEARVRANAALAGTKEEWDARAKAALSQAKTAWQGEAETARARYEEDLKAATDQRIAAREAEWREKAARDVAEARRETARAGQANADGALGELQAKLSAAEEKLRERERAAKAAADEAERERERIRREAAAHMTEAERTWQAVAETRFNEARDKWREAAAKDMAEMLARAERAEGAAREAKAQTAAQLAASRESGDEELRRLRSECASAKSATADREAELVQLKKTFDETRIRLRQEAEAVLAKAKSEWKSDLDARIAAAAAAAREKSAAALTEALSRCETAESTLAQIRRSNGHVGFTGSDSEVRRLKDEIVLLQKAVADRDAELARGGSDYAPGQTIEKIVLKPRAGWSVTDDGAKEKPKRRGGILRDIVVAGTLAASVIVFYPYVVPYVPEGVRTQIAAAAGRIAPVLGQDAGPANAVPLALAPAPEPRKLSVSVRSANVRSGPATGNAVVATLARDTVVTFVEQTGDWTHIAIAAADGQAGTEGWVSAAFLKDVAASVPPTP